MKSLLFEMAERNIDTINIDLIVQAAMKGDMFSIELIEKASSHLGKQIANLIKIFDPPIVLISGTLAEAGQYVINPIRTIVDKYQLYYKKERVEINVSSIGKKAVGLGAALIILKQLYKIDEDKVPIHI